MSKQRRKHNPTLKAKVARERRVSSTGIADSLERIEAIASSTAQHVLRTERNSGGEPGRSLLVVGYCPASSSLRSSDLRSSFSPASRWTFSISSAMRPISRPMKSCCLACRPGCWSTCSRSV